MSNLEVNASKINEIIGYHKDAGTPMPSGEWPWNFLNSVLSQCSSGRKDLSPRQVEVLDGIKNKWGKAAFEKKSALNAAWQERFNSDPQVKQRTQWVVDSLNAQSLSRYGWSYIRSRETFLNDGWWSKVRCLWDSTGQISERDYGRMVANNSYSKKLIETMEAPPRFDCGQLVSLRAGVLNGLGSMHSTQQAYQRLLLRWPEFANKKRHIATSMKDGDLVVNSSEKLWELQRDRKRNCIAMVIGIDPVPSISNAKNSRTYELLPVGELAEALKPFVLEERWLKKAPKSK